MAIQEQRQESKKKPGKAAPTVLNGKGAPPKRILIFGGGTALIILLLLIFFCSPQKETTTGTLQQAAAPSTPGPAPTERPAAPSPGRLKDINTTDLPSIRSIRLQPFQPTRMDAIKAEVVTASPPDSGPITCAYAWKVNDRIVSGTTGDTLDLSAFKKGDLVMVDVTPYAGDKAGYPVRSPFIVIHGITPSLDLKTARQTRKAGEPVEFQLVSLHPDSDDVAFSLEAPIVPGMSIDSRSGKITWISQPNQKGTISFGAAVEDTDKTKVTKTFKMTIE